MAVETASHISELNPATIDVGTDPVEGGEQVNLVKTVLTTDFANIDAAVTASAADLNTVDVTTLGTAETSKVLTVSAGDAINAAIVTWSNLGEVTTVDINGGTVDGVTIGGASAGVGTFTNLTVTGTLTASGGDIEGTVGGTTPAAGTFTTLTANTSFVLNGSTAITSVDTDLSSTSASHDTMTTALAVKTYADSVVSGYALETYVDARALETVTFYISDVSTAATYWIPIGTTGVITRVDTVIDGSVDSNTSIDTKTSTDQGISNITVASAGSGAGDVDSDTSINNSSVTAGTAIKIVCGGEGTTTSGCTVSITIDIS